MGIGAALMRLHQDKGGVTFHMERTVKEFHDNDAGAVKSVRLDDGTVLEADVVIMGAGVVPATKFVSGVTKERDHSIVADEYMQAAEGLFVGGDIARYPYYYTQSSVRIEHFGTALLHGRLAALNMLGRQVPNRAVPFFWTAQYGKSVR